MRPSAGNNAVRNLAVSPHHSGSCLYSVSKLRYRRLPGADYLRIPCDSVQILGSSFRRWSVDEDYALSFQELHLDSLLLRAIEASGFRLPTEVQRQVIPLALEGRDVMASAQTGTGKTAAFVLPALQRLLTSSKARGRGPRRAPVLTPTRELANQINESIRQLGRFTRCSFGTIVGGVAYPPQQQLLGRLLDVLVATPGRLLDHMERGRVDFSRLEVLALDQADRMLDMGFIEDVERIAAAMLAGRQSLLFGATLEGDILLVAKRLLQDPVRVQIASIKERHPLDRAADAPFR